MNKRSLLVVGLTAGLGLTVALFVAGVAFTDPAIQGAAKMGALLSFFVAPVVLLLARTLKVKQADNAPRHAEAAVGAGPIAAAVEAVRRVSQPVEVVE